MEQKAPVMHVCRRPADLVRQLSDANAAVLAGQPVDARIRPPISRSWRRSLDAGIDPRITSAPLVHDPGTLRQLRAEHPLGRHLLVLRGMLRSATDQTAHQMVIADGEGHLLWSEGPPGLRRAVDSIGLTAGACWSERSVGTNGIGTALAEGSPQYVYSAEHLVPMLHRVACAGAPIADPDTGRVIGCIDVSARAKALHPAMVSLVTAVARLAESRLALEMYAADERLRVQYLSRLGGPGALVTVTGRVLAAEPAGWCTGRIPLLVDEGPATLPDGRLVMVETVGEARLLRALTPGESRPALWLSLLGGEQPQVRVGERTVPLSLRHAEILALLILHPRGLTAERLSAYVYGDEGNPGTIRAEIHRLRAQLGGIISAKPYRLDVEADADFQAVRRRLAAGDVTGAVRLYGGELLPRSESPELCAERAELAVRLRRQVLDGGGVESLWDYAQDGACQDDLEVFQRLAAVLPPGDPRQISVQLRVRRLTRDG
ncbi:transcriptional regulator [Actinomadura craniellae]|uniref:Transcriptional regulator n=1 Tax=Actinomadura craniellae TaxID=2231787 RepID=A0A365HCK8_9ACTN|nr:GAF domain-containing protein [Actinomadura craniellae]RAY16656.1 transcriptional regulator [Actinomadura craniellae]